MDVVIGRVEICLREGEGSWNQVRKGRRLGDCGNFLSGYGGKVEFMVKQMFLMEQWALERLGHEAKEAGVRPCAEREYLFSLGGKGREKADDKVVNSASADVGSW